MKQASRHKEVKMYQVKIHNRCKLHLIHLINSEENHKVINRVILRCSIIKVLNQIKINKMYLPLHIYLKQSMLQATP